MSFAEDFSKFHQMEEKMNLFNEEICGEKFWALIRFPIYSLTFGRASSAATTSMKMSAYSKLKRFMFSLLSWRRNPLLIPKSQILFVFPGRRILENDGRWWDIYSDPIIKYVKHHSAAIESPYKNRHYEPAATHGLRYLDLIEFLTFAKRLLGIARIHLTKSDIRLLSKIRSELLVRFEIDVDVVAVTRRVLENRKAVVPLYKWLIRHIRPKVVVLAQGYGYEDLIEACSSLGIPTVELQHGAINAYHVGYSFAGKIGIKKNFPDYLLTWGDYWSSAAEFPTEKKRVLSVGFPYIESKKNLKSTKKKQIVFVSQETVGVALSKFAKELSSNKNLDYKIVYKLHPHERADWRARYPWLVSSGITVIDQPKDLLYKLFSESLIQIGVYSTALFEGLAFGLRTFLLDTKGVETMDSLLRGGLVKKVSSPEELLGYIRNAKPPTEFEFEYFFKTNSLENISAFLDTFFQGSSQKSTSRYNSN
jgi:hypothetical protein